MKHFICYRQEEDITTGTSRFLLYITDQSHISNDFGPEKTSFPSATYFVASNGIKLKSCAGPEWYRQEDTAYLRGFKSARNQNPLVFTDKTDRDRVMRAIEEYNRANGGFGDKHEIRYETEDDVVVPRYGAPGGNAVAWLLKITHQSHVGTEFGPVINGIGSFTYGITLQSLSGPLWDSLHQVAFLWGSSGSSNNVPLVFYAKHERDWVIGAIEAYNRSNGGFSVVSAVQTPVQEVHSQNGKICPKCKGTKKIQTLLLNRIVEDPCMNCNGGAKNVQT